MNPNLYPASPKLANYDIVKPSKRFQKVAISVIASITFFFLFYLLLVLVAAGVMAGAVYAGIMLIALRPGFLTLAAGGGIIALGVMLFIFMFKFIFSSQKNENPLRMQLKQEDYPDLFDFIRQLTEDTKTKFPKKIFVSPDVNAMVFYNSSFLSLFFPTRKNLEIGLGLVNSLTISEFKAVLAHEFGHFSQRSMKIGSYIYTVNRVIYNLVFEYDSWDEWLNRWAQTGGIFGFFAGITFWMVERVRSLLKVAYNLMNINYMKLSREMEYHADLVAVSVAGVEPFKNALRKIEFSSFAYDYTTGNLQSLSAKEKASANLYSNHRFIMSLLARHNNIRMDKDHLIITDEDLSKTVVKSRVNVKDQWASHPTLDEREANISNVDVNSDQNSAPAWRLFEDAEYLQERVTKNIYRNAFPGADFVKINDTDFEDFANTEMKKYQISEAYNGFYDDRHMHEFDPRELINVYPYVGSFEELYSKKNLEVIKKHFSNQNDLQLLGQIATKQIPTKIFEFDGKKYKRSEAHKLIGSLKEEVNQGKLDIERLDKESFTYNYQRAKLDGEEKLLLQKYLEYFEELGRVKQLEEVGIRFQNFANRLYAQPRWTEEGVRQLAAELSSIEKEFKDFLNRQAMDTLVNVIEVEGQQEVLKEYLSSTNYYSKTYEFDEQAFIKLSNLIHDVQQALGILYGRKLKELTDFQLRLHVTE